MEITWSSIVGKIILVGLTYTDSKENIIERKQFHGKIVDADNENGISILIDGKKDIFCLPPDLSAIQIASPGEYRLNKTSEVVVNPDLLSTWIIKKPE